MLKLNSPCTAITVGTGTFTTTMCIQIVGVIFCLVGWYLSSFAVSLCWKPSLLDFFLTKLSLPGCMLFSLPTSEAQVLLLGHQDLTSVLPGVLRFKGK